MNEDNNLSDRLTMLSDQLYYSLVRRDTQTAVQVLNNIEELTANTESHVTPLTHLEVAGATPEYAAEVIRAYKIAAGTKEDQ